MDQRRYILFFFPSWHDQNCLYSSSNKLGKKSEISFLVREVNYLLEAEFIALLTKLSKRSNFQQQLCYKVPRFLMFLLASRLEMSG